MSSQKRPPYLVKNKKGRGSNSRQHKSAGTYDRNVVKLTSWALSSTCEPKNINSEKYPK